MWLELYREWISAEIKSAMGGVEAHCCNNHDQESGFAAPFHHRSCMELPQKVFFYREVMSKEQVWPFQQLPWKGALGRVTESLFLDDSGFALL